MLNFAPRPLSPPRSPRPCSRSPRRAMRPRRPTGSAPTRLDQSDAHDSCQGVAIKVQDGECWINAGCRRDNGWQYRITQITASVADTANLVVCDGNLTIDSCGGSDGGTDGGSN